MTAVVAIINALVAGIPMLVKLLRSGKTADEIKLADFISTDALEVLESAKDEAQDYIDNG